jgi:hypothetical protein
MLYEHALEVYLEHEHFCDVVEQFLEQLRDEIRYRYSVVANEVQENEVAWNPQKKQMMIK